MVEQQPFYTLVKAFPLIIKKKKHDPSASFLHGKAKVYTHLFTIACLCSCSLFFNTSLCPCTILIISLANLSSTLIAVFLPLFNSTSSKIHFTAPLTLAFSFNTIGTGTTVAAILLFLIFTLGAAANIASLTIGNGGARVRAWMWSNMREMIPLARARFPSLVMAEVR